MCSEADSTDSKVKMNRMPLPSQLCIHCSAVQSVGYKNFSARGQIPQWFWAVKGTGVGTRRQVENSINATVHMKRRFGRNTEVWG